MHKSATEPTLKRKTHTIIRVEYMEKIAEPQGMWSSNFFQAAHAQYFFYL